MKDIAILLCFLLLNIGLRAQYSSAGFPLHEYAFSRQIYADLAEGKLSVSRAAVQLAYIGRYAAAQEIPNNPELEWGFDSLSHADSLRLLSLRPEEAVEYILRLSQDHQVLILNEAHHLPQHRAFTGRLLKGLYERGFRYFGLEALTNNLFDTTRLLMDTALAARGYPLRSDLSGTYSRDPQMGLLIREGIRQGFQLFAYERLRPGDREFQQAENIINKILRKDPQAKIVIHCGWYHLLETQHRGVRWMASYLKDLSGIDPLTIYQDLLTEHYAGPESPYYSLLYADRPSIWVYPDGTPFRGPPGTGRFDLLVYHPRTTYRRNRPGWLLADGQTRLVPIDHEALQVGYPCLVEAHPIDEPPEATPVDIIELGFPWDPTALVLRPGQYRLRIRDTEGERQQMIITVNGSGR